MIIAQEKKTCQSVFGMIYVFMDFVDQRNGIGFFYDCMYIKCL